MTTLRDLVSYLDEYLTIREIPDEANAVNGLQVENRGGVGMIVAAVDASQATIDGAIARGAGLGAPPLLLVHHGLFWDGNIPVSGRRYRRLQSLLANDIAVYSAHIPLDVHPEVGNNAVLGRKLGLVDLEPFDNYKGVALGIQGSLATGEPREALMDRLTTILGDRPLLIAGGPPEARRIGVITGAGGSRIGAARDAGLDTFVTGEGPHHTYFDAMEFGINVIYGGHYATEQLGVQALGAHLSARFGLPWEFHHHPTGL